MRWTSDNHQVIILKTCSEADERLGLLNKSEEAARLLKLLVNRDAAAVTTKAWYGSVEDDIMISVFFSGVCWLLNVSIQSAWDSACRQR